MRASAGSVFPAVVVGVIVVGLLLVFYARATVPGLDATAEANVQRRAAFGVYVCDQWVTLPAPPVTAFSEFGVTDLQDGIVLMTSLPDDGARGPRLGAFLDAYGMSLNDTALEVPGEAAPEGGPLFEEGTDSCAEGDGLLSVRVWDPASDPGSGQTYITAFDDVRLPNDAMAFTIAFTPRDTDVPQPPSVAALQALIAGTPTENTAGATTSAEGG